MELERAIFDSAREGELHRLRILLDHKPIEEVSLLVSARTNGSTPLVMACRNGHLEVVLYLIEKCRADIELAGSVIFDGETVEGAPPLWCAAAAGHLNLVKCLLSYNASVNSTTKSNSTPLRAACFDGHFEIAKYLIEHGADIEIANKHGHTCLMIACYKGHCEIADYLVKCGADVNRKSQKGNTALHDCAESGNLVTLKLLLQNGATYISYISSKTPLLSAALIGQAEIVEYFIQEINITKEEKIDALELLGATFIDKNRGMSLAIDCWRQAMELRYEDRDCLIEKSETLSPISAFLDATEVQTLSQLEDLILDPDEMKMQALLVRERILGPGHPDNLYYIRKRGATYANNGDFNRSMQLWMYALDALPKGHPLELLYFLKHFSHMMSEALPFATGFPVVSFRDILCVFERALKEIERTIEASKIQHTNSNYYSCHIIGTSFIAIFLLGLMCGLQSHMNKSEELELKKAAHKLVHINPKTRNGWTTLHFTCFKEFLSLGVFIFQNSYIQSKVVDLLLEVGASPNALDSNHNTPLHIAAMNKPCPRVVFNSLLNHGAHLDQCNNKKQTPLQLAQHMPLLDIYPLQYLNLQCLSAKVVQSHKIPYKGFVHKELEVFIDVH